MKGDLVLLLEGDEFREEFSKRESTNCERAMYRSKASLLRASLLWSHYQPFALEKEKRDD